MRFWWNYAQNDPFKIVLLYIQKCFSMIFTLFPHWLIIDYNGLKDSKGFTSYFRNKYCCILWRHLVTSIPAKVIVMTLWFLSQLGLDYPQSVLLAMLVLFITYYSHVGWQGFVSQLAILGFSLISYWEVSINHYLEVQVQFESWVYNLFDRRASGLSSLLTG